jgi:hypothetical protein
MNFKSMKNGFKMTTVALTIMSIVGCTLNKKEDYDSLITNERLSNKYDSKAACVAMADNEYKNIKTKIENKTGIMNVTFISEYLKISKNKDLILIYEYCKNVNLKYEYNVIVEKNSNKNYLEDLHASPTKSYSEETFGKVGQFVAIPFIVVGVVILTPFYIINYISK